MNVLLISQCDKRALLESRRLLDQFAERRGDRTWQTPITQQGLDVLRRLLKKTARRNTSVACHWIRGRDHSELLWVVGDASRFNAQGAVPTNSTERDVLREQDQNDWHTGEDIRLLAAMAALFHDIGKANSAFQRKLANHNGKPIADVYRHEWVSLRMFEAFVGNDDDQGWLNRLASAEKSLDSKWIQKIVCDGITTSASSPFRNLPPLAQAVGWLVLSHHRLPALKYNCPASRSRQLERLPQGLTPEWNGARTEIDANSTSQEQITQNDIAACWSFPKSVPLASLHWRQHVSKLAQRMLRRPGMLASDWLNNPYVSHLSRLVLMLADHYYSAQPAHARYGDANFPLYANTDRQTRKLKQRLDEHLIGVEINSGRIAHALSQLSRQLPSIAQAKAFKRRSNHPAYRWQDKAFDLARALQKRSASHGFFGVNMASTGCGKTLANGRIIYGLANPQHGSRFSVALGLRSLTLQTGAAYRQRLHLGDDDLGVLVGGAAAKALFKRANPTLESSGSESADALLDELGHVHYQGSMADGALKQWLGGNADAQRLINAPVLVSTVDHLIPATEGTRGGRQIAPMLRLMTSDLVLDEPDDFDLNDLPALSRLVHWAGLLGSRVLLSSATLPPALVQGLFTAYLEGRRQYQANRGTPGQALSVSCAWFDEFNSQASEYGDCTAFAQAHVQFVAKRVERLADPTKEIRRRAQIQPLSKSFENKADSRTELAIALHGMLHQLHREHCNPDPKSEKRVSFGVIRLANIDPLMDVAQALLKLGAQSGHRIHLCCYHSKHLLLMRSRIESCLDRFLNRHQPDAIFADAQLRIWLDRYSEPDHIFVVLGSPVVEVGRDHDYDWGIIEPSSMRSIIQMAGRVRRHRPGSVASSNLYLLERNIKALEGAKTAFQKPGFEQTEMPLESHSLFDLLTSEQLTMIDARPRIQERPLMLPHVNLADLEHQRLRDLMLGNHNQGGLSVPHWWQTHAALSGELQRSFRFRRDDQKRQRYVMVPNENLALDFMAQQEDGSLILQNQKITSLTLEFGPRIGFWGDPDYLSELETLALEEGLTLEACARRYGSIDLAEPDSGAGWLYHPALGFRRN